LIEGITGDYTIRAKERVGMLGAEGAFQLTVGVVRVRAACAPRSPTDNSLVTAYWLPSTVHFDDLSLALIGKVTEVPKKW
jgi:hypothetical protein